MKKQRNMMDFSSVAVIVPTYNEKENILHLIEQIRRNIGDTFIYVVDDNSPDGTQEIVRNYATEKDNRVSLIVRRSKSGRGGAVLSGFEEALKNPKLEYFIEMDADFSHKPSDMPRILDKRGPKMVVVASRYTKGGKIMNWSIRRRIMSRFANAYIRMILRVPVRDCTNGYRCYPRVAVKLIIQSGIQQKGFISLSETLYLLYKRGFSFVEVPFNFVDREKGKSNANLMELLKSFSAIFAIKRKYK